MRRELEVIRDELHATHVRVVASDPARLDTVAAAVVEAGLGLWYSPAVFDCDPAETARNTVAMAGHAEALRRRRGGTSPSSPAAKRPCSSAGSCPANVSPTASHASKPTRRCSTAATWPAT